MVTTHQVENPHHRTYQAFMVDRIKHLWSQDQALMVDLCGSKPKAFLTLLNILPIDKLRHKDVFAHHL